MPSLCRHQENLITWFSLHHSLALVLQVVVSPKLVKHLGTFGTVRWSHMPSRKPVLQNLLSTTGFPDNIMKAMDFPPEKCSTTHTLWTKGFWNVLSYVQIHYLVEDFHQKIQTNSFLSSASPCFSPFFKKIHFKSSKWSRIAHNFKMEKKTHQYLLFVPCICTTSQHFPLPN